MWKIACKKRRKTSSSDDTEGTEVQQATNLDVLFCGSIEKLWIPLFFQIGSIKWVLIDICYIEPIQNLIKV
jgi:hypothetical protein